jgi:hypothetical protein
MTHPDHQEVIPLAPEPTEKQDRSEKNDCERNAAKRLLRRIRHEHPHLKPQASPDRLGAVSGRLAGTQEPHRKRPPCSSLNARRYRSAA